jgi:hypothetical protein
MHFDRLIEIYTMVYSILQFNNVTKTGAAILLDLLVIVNFGCQTHVLIYVTLLT